MHVALVSMFHVVMFTSLTRQLKREELRAMKNIALQALEEVYIRSGTLMLFTGSYGCQVASAAGVGESEGGASFFTLHVTV